LKGDVTSAVKRTGGAVALCSYTTVVGYSSLLFSDQQALQSFGQLAMSGEIACISGALLVLPAVLHLLSRGGKTYASETKDPPATPPPSALEKVGPAKDQVVPGPVERPVDLAP
jgi:predicted RND superfamily exporter protein